MKVAKFGGSSLSDANQIKKVSQIVKNDDEIGVVVVSAPGKRHDDDIKVTDLLIALHTNHVAGLETDDALEEILDRYRDIVEDLDLDKALIETFKGQLKDHLSQITDSDRLLDALKSCGENFNAILISQYFQKVGLSAKYMSPKEVGICVTDEPANATLLPESYDEIAKIKGFDGVIVVPGFFGYTKDDEIVTFSRGGSDITGAIIARGVNASIYENYTDQSYIYSAHPGIVKGAHAIKEVTYREMRELSYSGFGIFHAEALAPLYEVKIPIMVRNTNEPEVLGTKIVSDRDDIAEFPVIGVAGDTGFMSITIKRYLLNREVGFMRRLLSVFEEHNINIEHVPTGIDDISVLFRIDQIESEGHLQKLIDDIQYHFDPEWIHVEHDLAMLAVVGEGMRDYIGVANRATSAFREANISLSMINQGASEISMFFSIDAGELDSAIKHLYNAFFL